MKVKKRIAQLLSFLMIFSLVMGNSNLQVNATGETYTVDFGTGSWTVGGVEVKADKNGIQNSFADNTEITLTGFDAETMEVKLSGAEGFSTTLTVTDDKTSLSAREGSGGLPDGTLTFSVVAKSSGGAGTTTYSVNFGEGSWTVGNVTVTATGKTGVQNLSETDEISLTGFNAETMEVKLTATGGFSTTLTVDESGKTSLSARGGNGGLPDETMTLSVEEKSSGGGGSGEQETLAVQMTVVNDNSYMLGDLTVDGVRVENSSVKVDKNDTHKIKITPGLTYKLLEVSINDQPMSLSGEDVIVDSVTGAITFTAAPVNGGYKIEAVFGTDGTHTLIWEYGDGSGTSTDATVTHGKIEIVSAENGNDIIDLTENPEEGGHFIIKKDAVVTVRLIPDYGYQLLTTSLNGGAAQTLTVAAGTEISTFTFTMPDTNLHLGAMFTQVPDKVTTASIE